MKVISVFSCIFVSSHARTIDFSDYILAIGIFKRRRYFATELRTKISEFLFSMKLQDTPSEGLDREKRLIPDAGFGAKNAILGYVFGVSWTTFHLKIIAHTIQIYRSSWRKCVALHTCCSILRQLYIHKIIHQYLLYILVYLTTTKRE